MPPSSAPSWPLRHLPLLIGIVLMIAMSVSLAWQTLAWLRQLREPAGNAASAAAAPASPPSLDNMQRLFGTPGSTADGPPPATNLRLTLHGSFVHNDPARSSAIIQREGSKPQRFGLGQELDAGVKLHAVYRDRVELERNGRLESLPFPSSRASSSDSGAEDGGGYGAPPTDDAIQPPVDNNDPLSGLQEENAEMLRQRMEALRQQMEAAGNLPPPETPTEQPMESD
ncbi:type II secretion system protein N [Pseudomonas sp. RIT-PI-AD]|uniref:type II secretion system protein N n=1 Tax=Pseudomonas sp. RIT-PI-AD TaxID=3035294 RepID=UPI0021D94866|nr:type II secretion system protein N [Pseudomonas sp. RIT-PI-AD]